MSSEQLPAKLPRRDASEHVSSSTTSSSAVRVVVPSDLPAELTVFLDIVASQVAIGGLPVEDELRRREASNRYFSFLTAAWNDPAALYYRWRLYSLLQGDTLSAWRVEPFTVQSNGTHVIVPPPMPPRLPLGDGFGDKKATTTDSAASAPLLPAVVESYPEVDGALKNAAAILPAPDGFAHLDSDRATLGFGETVLPIPAPSCVPHIRTKVVERLLSAIAAHHHHFLGGSGSVCGFFEPLTASDEAKWRKLTQPASLMAAAQEQGGAAAISKMLEVAEASLSRRAIKKRSVYVGERAEHTHHLLAIIADFATQVSLLRLPPLKLSAEAAGQWHRLLAADMLALLFTVHEVAMNAKHAVGAAASASSGHTPASLDEMRREVSYADVVEDAVELTAKIVLEAAARLAVRMAQRGSAAGICGGAGLPDAIGNVSVSLGGFPPHDLSAEHDAAVGAARVLLSWLPVLFAQWKATEALSVRTLTDIATKFGTLLHAS